MKKIISTCIALMVSAACSISAFAMEVPTNTTIQDLNGVRQYIKIYTVAPDTDPQSLIDDVFEYDGYTYTYSSMTKEERSYSEKEHHTETVTADTEKSDLSVVLKALSPSIEYDDGEFRGTLYLDHSTISTVFQCSERSNISAHVSSARLQRSITGCRGLRYLSTAWTLCCVSCELEQILCGFRKT